MDIAVSLVKTYLQMNGFFTIAEYPILEAVGQGAHRTVTDVDILGISFPGAGSFADDAATRGIQVTPDPALDLTESHIEVIIGEVKEGAAVLNPSATDPDVLLAVLRRLGQMDPELAAGVVEDLRADGEAFHPAGIRVRLMVFASKPPDQRRPSFRWMSLAVVGRWLAEQIREHWDSMKSVQSKDPALGFLILFEKAIRGDS